MDDEAGREKAGEVVALCYAGHSLTRCHQC